MQPLQVSFGLSLTALFYQETYSFHTLYDHFEQNIRMSISENISVKARTLVFTLRIFTKLPRDASWVLDCQRLLIANDATLT